MSSIYEDVFSSRLELSTALVIQVSKGYEEKNIFRGIVSVSLLSAIMFEELLKGLCYILILIDYHKEIREEMSAETWKLKIHALHPGNVVLTVELNYMDTKRCEDKEKNSWVYSWRVKTNRKRLLKNSCIVL